jgi:AcrR family transcriptional regulator
MVDDSLADSAKDQKFKAVAAASLELLALHGPKGINVSRIAAKAKVSRAWIYKYIGSSQDALLEFATECIGQFYAPLETGFSGRTLEAWAKDEMMRLDQNLKALEAYPWILALYFRYKGTPTPVGRAIDKVEVRFLEKKIQQLQSALGTSPQKAQLFAEWMLAFKWALAHRWQAGGLGKKYKKKDWDEELHSLFLVIGRWERG